MFEQRRAMLMLWVRTATITKCVFTQGIDLGLYYLPCPAVANDSLNISEQWQQED